MTLPVSIARKHAAISSFFFYNVDYSNSEIDQAIFPVDRFHDGAPPSPRIRHKQIDTPPWYFNNQQSSFGNHQSLIFGCILAASDTMGR